MLKRREEDEPTEPSPSGREYPRVIGRLSGDGESPRVVVTTGIHGNELAGPAAAERVLSAIRERGLPVHGQLLVLAGNLKAMAERTRFVDRDLNRDWTGERIASARSKPVEGRDAEDRELLELLEHIREFVGDHTDLTFVDLHTSSADGAPFVTIGDTLRNRRFARHFPLPTIVGLEEQVDDSLLEFLNNRGLVTFGVEGGQHDSPKSIDAHESALWLAFVRAGLLDEASVDRAAHRARLKAAIEGVPGVLEVRFRHAITAEDEFRMRPGYVNFQKIRKGEHLADDRNGPIYAPENGRILLPLYQGKGDDGFFLCREFSPFWLGVSAALRRLRVGRIMHWLPGVQRHPSDDDLLQVNTRVAALYPLQIFHLLGYRKRRPHGDQSALWVSRRKHDLKPPEKIVL